MPDQSSDRCSPRSPWSRSASPSAACGSACRFHSANTFGIPWEEAAATRATSCSSSRANCSGQSACACANTLTRDSGNSPAANASRVAGISSKAEATAT